MSGLFSIPGFPEDELKQAISQKKDKHKKDKKKEGKPEKSCEIFGQKLKCNPAVQVLVGPVIGKVTTNSAIVLLEISSSSKITVHLLEEGKDDTISQTKFLQHKVPMTFFFEELKPATKYRVCVEGATSKSTRKAVGSFKTFEEKPKKVRVAIVSCDRPERHLPGEKLMWKVLSDRLEKDEIDLMVHIGDQVYAQKESVDAAAIYNHSDHNDHPELEERKKRLVSTYEAARNRLADVYRFTWSLPYTAKVLANCPHLMIWSDNDIYNDFTIAEGVSPILIKLGQQTYRLYQRALWDENIFDDSEHTQEQHFHKYGSLGVMILDMRGNRVDSDGKQYPDKPIVSDEQWKQIEEMLADSDIKGIIVCAEIPFVSEAPEKVKKGAEKVPFLKDHWCYNDQELFRLLDTLFSWKSRGGEGEREVVLVGGDIHVGVNSVVKDSKTNLEIKQITTSPITNHVCDFFPDREGALNERYSYVHVPLDHQKNYGYFVFEVSDDGKASIDAQLIGDKMC